MKQETVILIPKDAKSGEAVFQGQENLAKKLKEHNIESVKAIMPSGETRLFKNVKFQVITGATAKELSQAFNDLATIQDLKKLISMLI